MLDRRAALLGISLSALAACGQPPRAQDTTPETSTYPWGAPINSSGINFDFAAVRYTGRFTNWINQPTFGSNFLIVEVNATNQTGAPLPAQFQPLYRLVDLQGALYEPHDQHTTMINFQQPGRLPPGQSMNPNTPARKAIVFEVARATYKLGVVVPHRSRAGLAGAPSARGSYFYVRLPEIA
jgi:hypothetical protein